MPCKGAASWVLSSILFQDGAHVARHLTLTAWAGEPLSRPLLTLIPHPVWPRDCKRVMVRTQIVP